MLKFSLLFSFFLDAFKGAFVFFVHKDLTAKMISVYYSDIFHRIFLLLFSSLGFFCAVFANCFLGFFLRKFFDKKFCNLVNKKNKTYIFVSKNIPRFYIACAFFIPVSSFFGSTYSFALGYFMRDYKKLFLFIFLSLFSYFACFFI